MTTNIVTVVLLTALAIAIETTFVIENSISDSTTVNVTSEPGGNQTPPPQQ